MRTTECHEKFKKWALIRKDVSKKYINLIQNMYESSRTSIKSMYGVKEDFNVEVGVHQGSDLSPYLFSEVIDEVTKEIQGEIWCIRFFDEIVLVKKIFDRS